VGDDKSLVEDVVYLGRLLNMGKDTEILFLGRLLTIGAGMICSSLKAAVSIFFLFWDEC